MNKIRIPIKTVRITDRRIRHSDKTDDEYEKLKDSVRRLGLSNPIIITRESELIDGFWRLKAFLELSDEYPDYDEFYTIPTLIVTDREEVEDLRIDFMDGASTDYMRDTACDRLNMIYVDDEFKKPLNEFLEINELELKNRIMVGEAIRENVFSVVFINTYKKGNWRHKDAVLRLELLGKTGPEPEPEPEEFDINKWV